MVDLIEKNIEKIQALCKEYNVKKLEVFGSAIIPEKFSPKSEIDMLVEFLPSEQGMIGYNYLRLLSELKRVLGREVDLIETEAIKNPYFIKGIQQNREDIYNA